MNLALRTSGLGKQYRLFHSDRSLTFQSVIINGFRKIRPKEKFWVLRDLDIELLRGRALGVIGRNGAGKSTLLRLVSGVIKPDKGQIQTSGRIGGLLGVGVGFHSELTGRENVIINGVISGMTRNEIRVRMEDIIQFAELENVIDDPLRTYSSGMRMRLGFSVVAHTDPEILLIDEVLAVGDLDFQQKCLERIKQFKANQCAILLVSHNLNSIRNICDEVLWLDHGQAALQGEAQVVIDAYKKSFGNHMPVQGASLSL